MTSRAKRSSLGTLGLIWSIPLAVLGLIPSFALFVWVERNMALPWIGTWIGWPWLFVEGGLAWSLAWNFFTIFVFAITHSAFAGGRVPRALYIFISGLASLFMLATWQPTGIILFQLIPSAIGASVVSMLVYWTLLVLAFRSITQFESAFVFVGLQAENPGESEPILATHGGYDWVRHPAYLLTLAAWFLTPMLSLDRFVFGVGMTIYLGFGIRLEERRLVAKFGTAYIAYQKRVPMLFPRMKNPSNTRS